MTMSVNLNSVNPISLVEVHLAHAIGLAWWNGADVINCSWGLPQYSALVSDAIDIATTSGRGGLGCVVVVAVANNGQESIQFPEDKSNVLAVGASTRNRQRASFSNFGSKLDIVAPGVNIRTTDIAGQTGYSTGDYTFQDGTSFAAPQVAGIAALLLSAKPSLTENEVRQLIQSTANRIGGYVYTAGGGEVPSLPWNREMGYGQVNAYQALTILPLLSQRERRWAGYHRRNLNRMTLKQPSIGDA